MLDISDKDGCRIVIEPIEYGLIRIHVYDLIEIDTNQAQQIIDYLQKQIEDE